MIRLPTGEEFNKVKEYRKRTTLWLYLHYLEIIEKRLESNCRKFRRLEILGMERIHEVDLIALDTEVFYIYSFTILKLGISVIAPADAKKLHSEPVAKHIIYVRNKALQHLYNDHEPELRKTINIRKGTVSFSLSRKYHFRNKTIKQIDAAFRKVLKKYGVLDQAINPR